MIVSNIFAGLVVLDCHFELLGAAFGGLAVFMMAVALSISAVGRYCLSIFHKRRGPRASPAAPPIDVADVSDISVVPFLGRSFQQGPSSAGERDAVSGQRRFPVRTASTLQGYGSTHQNLAILGRSCPPERSPILPVPALLMCPVITSGAPSAVVDEALRFGLVRAFSRKWSCVSPVSAHFCGQSPWAGLQDP